MGSKKKRMGNAHNFEFLFLGAHNTYIPKEKTFYFSCNPSYFSVLSTVFSLKHFVYFGVIFLLLFYAPIIYCDFGRTEGLRVGEGSQD